MAESSTKQAKSSNEANILAQFARNQLQHVNRQLFSDSTFLVLAVSAYLYGAENHLRHQAQMDFRHSQVKLVALLKTYFNMNTRSALHMVMSIDEYAKRYYLIENIVAEGKKHAEKWLNCLGDDNNYLEKLIAQYHHQSMFALGIESISDEYQLQQKKMFSSVDQSVKKLRKRLFIILAVATVVFSALAFVLLKTT